jgi:outer membrane protein OmpA-like peptidoglycan-associated protein
LLKEDPKNEKASAWISSCSLMTEAAVTQVRAQQARLERARLQDERIKAQGELVATQDEIFKLERGYASSLKADLDEQKRKAAAAKDDAEKRFSELNSALIQVSKDARGTIISMSDILFDVGKATLTQDLKTNLAKIAGILTIYKDANVQVEGHTDNVGGEEYNQKLSEKRASNVMEFLVSPGGIAAARLTSVGYGFTKPIADNATKEGRQKNRRVDLVIMDKKAP